MALEDLTGTKYIDDLVVTNPAAGDNVSQGDDHIRGIKNVLKDTFPNITGAVTPTHTELNYVDGVTSAIQTQLGAITANDWVTNARVAANAIDSDQYVDGSIDTAHLSADCVTTAKIADDVALGGSPTTTTQAESDDSTKIATTAYVVDKITTLIGGAPSTLNDLNELAAAINDDANYNSTLTTALGTKAPLASPTFTGNIAMPAGSIDHGFLAADCVDGDNLADNAVDSEHYTDGSIDTAHFAAGAVDAAAMGANSVDSSELVNGSVDLSHMSANSVDSPQYVDGSIDTAHYAAGSVNLAAMKANSVDSDQYVDGSIDTAHLSDGSVTADKIGGDAINHGDKIADGVIQSEHYADGSIDTAHYADNSVTGVKLALDRRGGTTQDIYTGNGHDYIFSDADVGLRFYTAGAEDMRLLDNGTLHVDGDVIAFSTTISDERLKHDIEPITDALSKVGQLNGCTFTYNNEDRRSAGLIAQDVEKVLPSAVSEMELPLQHDDGIAYKTVQYDQTIGLLVEAIKELTAKVEKLENR